MLGLRCDDKLLLISTKMAVLDKLLFKVAHLLLWVYTVLQSTWTSWKRKPIHWQLKPYHRKDTFRRCHDERTKLQKLPHHLSIVFAEENISYQDVANIVVWCAAVGISYLSIYDSEGVMKIHSQELTYHITEKQKQLLEREGSQVIIETSSSCHPNSELEQNNHNKIDVSLLKSSTSYPIHLNVLGPEDGQPYLARAARQYCSSGTIRGDPQGDVEEDINLSRILQETYNFPDPDLLIRFGSISSLLGFLPWQIRLTEIISHASHHDLDYESFLQLLHIYARTEQRFGK